MKQKCKVWYYLDPGKMVKNKIYRVQINMQPRGSVFDMEPVCPVLIYAECSDDGTLRLYAGDEAAKERMNELEAVNEREESRDVEAQPRPGVGSGAIHSAESERA